MPVKLNETNIKLYKGNGRECSLYKGSTKIYGFENSRLIFTGNTRIPNTCRQDINSLTIYGKSVFSSGTVKSVISPFVSLSGKNILNTENFGNYSNWTMGSVYSLYYLDLPAGYYTFSCNFRSENPNIYFMIRGNADYSVCGAGTYYTRRTFRVSEGERIRFAWNQSRMNQTTLTDLLTNFMTNIQLEAGSEKSEYFPFQGETSALYQNIVLRSVPLSSGYEIMDSIDVATGVLTRYVDPEIDNCTQSITDKTEYVYSSPHMSDLTPHLLKSLPVSTQILTNASGAISLKVGQ